MAPIKFEEHVKEKLDEREIQPSAASWDKLSSRLDESEISSGRKLWFSAIAAVAVLLIASTIFINQQNQNATPVVNRAVQEEPGSRVNENSIKDPIQVASEEKAENIDQEAGRSEIINSRSGIEENEIAESTDPENESSVEETIFEPTPKRPIIKPLSVKSEMIAESSVEPLSNKVLEVLEKIKNENNSLGDLTNAEVDALLTEAANEISRERNLNSGGNISADALLADVEYEVDQSFRKEVFDFLKEEFLKAKTAVATRND